MKLIEFTDEELIDELMNRNDDLIIAIRRRLDLEKDDFKAKQDVRTWWIGDTLACLGLAETLKWELQKDRWGIKES